MKRLPKKYIAGFFDGEGCIDFRPNKLTNGHTILVPRVRIGLAESGLDVLEMIHNTYGGGIYKRESKNPAWQDSYSWELSNYKRVCMFLREIVVHLVIKKEQARLVLWMETNFKGKYDCEEHRRYVKEELTAMKLHPHRLSEIAQEKLLGML